MPLKKFGLIGLVAILTLTIPTGCEDDRPPKVDGIEEVTSPTQIGDWMAQLKAILRTTNTTGAEASRILAYASIAYYEGYALSADDMRSLVGQLEGLNELPSPSPGLSYNYGVIAESAMTTVLLHLFADAPQNIKLVISSTYSEHERDYLLLGVLEPVIDRSRALGELIGGSINNWADADGYANVMNCSVSIPSGPQYWQPSPGGLSPELPCWGNLRPFTFNSGELIVLCHPGIPMEVSTGNGSDYDNDIASLIDIQSNLSDEEKAAALFWSDGPGTYTVPGHYVSILEQLISQNLLNGKQTVTAMTQLCIAMADTYISTYKLKYTYFRPRPQTIIRAQSDPNWESFVVNPATPEYPSLRSTMAYAATQVFINLYGNIAFTDDTHSILSLDERNYDSFTEMGEEAALSRSFAGTGLNSTLVNSEYHGRCIAQRANELFFNQ